MGRSVVALGLLAISLQFILSECAPIALMQHDGHHASALDILWPENEGDHFTGDQLDALNKGLKPKQIFTATESVAMEGKASSKLTMALGKQKALESLGKNLGDQKRTVLQQKVGLIVEKMLCRMRVGMNLAQETPGAFKIVQKMRTSDAYLAHKADMDHLKNCVKDEMNELHDCAENTVKAQEGMLADDKLGQVLTDMQSDLYKIPGFKTKYFAGTKKAGCESGHPKPGLFASFDDDVDAPPAMADDSDDAADVPTVPPAPML